MSNIFFCCGVQLVHLEIEYYFVHMAAEPGLIPHSIGSILVHFFEFNCVWFVVITIFFNGASQNIGQRCQTTAFRLIRQPSIVWRNKSIMVWDVWQVAPSCWDKHRSHQYHEEREQNNRLPFWNRCLLF